MPSTRLKSRLACRRIATAMKQPEEASQEAPAHAEVLQFAGGVTSMIDTVRVELRRKKKHAWWLIDPRTNPYISHWDTMTSLARE